MLRAIPRRNYLSGERRGSVGVNGRCNCRDKKIIEGYLKQDNNSYFEDKLTSKTLFGENLT